MVSLVHFTSTATSSRKQHTTPRCRRRSTYTQPSTTTTTTSASIQRSTMAATSRCLVSYTSSSAGEPNQCDRGRQCTTRSLTWKKENNHVYQRYTANEFTTTISEYSCGLPQLIQNNLRCILEFNLINLRIIERGISPTALRDVKHTHF